MTVVVAVVVVVATVTVEVAAALSRYLVEYSCPVITYLFTMKPAIACDVGHSIHDSAPF